MKNLQPFIVIAFVALIAAGCASAPSHFYTLNSPAVGDGSTNSNYAVIIGPVSITGGSEPAAVHSPGRAQPGRCGVRSNRWAAPLTDNIARAVAGDLVALLGTAAGCGGAHANFESAYRVSISVQRFESVPGKSVLVDAMWVIRPPASAVVQPGRTVVHEPVTGNDFDAIAAAHSRALAKVSSDIAAAIRAGADKKFTPQK
ncbi:MAG: PqiC family protein [Limisphaerales bacterium]